MYSYEVLVSETGLAQLKFTISESNRPTSVETSAHLNSTTTFSQLPKPRSLETWVAHRLVRDARFTDSGPILPAMQKCRAFHSAMGARALAPAPASARVRLHMQQRNIQDVHITRTGKPILKVQGGR